jgi:seryl-tRNA synthetase
MLDLNRLRENPDAVRTAIRHKGGRNEDVVDSILAIDEHRRSSLTRLQEVQNRSNEISKEIGEMMRRGRNQEAQPLMQESGSLKEEIKSLQEQVDDFAGRLEALMLEVPNIPHESVPVGRTEADNVVAAEVGTKPAFDFEAVPHWDLAERHNLIDFERGSKVTGAGFPFYRGAGAVLQRALINFFLDLATERGYEELQAPLVVNEASARGTGQLPDKEDLMYEAQRDGLYLIPTAEVPVTNFFRNEILDEASLPIQFCAYTPCFRREAGSYGKDVRGLNRLHQFDKVELVRFVRPSDSYDALEALRQDAEEALARLELPYRRLLMCTGDMGFTQSKKYDLEVWAGGQQRWLEVSSISNFEDFQARRMAIRYRPTGKKKPELVHTLNGSGLALPRIVAALLENNQRQDGSIVIPEALSSYTRFDRIG